MGTQAASWRPDDKSVLIENHDQNAQSSKLLLNEGARNPEVNVNLHIKESFQVDSP
jgi:hypothetical protein